MEHTQEFPLKILVKKKKQACNENKYNIYKIKID